MIALDNMLTEQLTDEFYRHTQPAPVKQPRLLAFNHQLAQFLCLNTSELSDDALARLFSGVQIPQSATPVAMAYAGHQFGQFVPQLGDGRAVLLGNSIATDGLSYDIQLKGSGQTEFSRNGDGKSALGPVLREYLMSEAMFNLGVPTTRSLAAVDTNEQVYRQNGPEPGGIFTRVARTHIRIGTFEYFAARQKVEQLKLLADFVIKHLYPDCAKQDNPYLGLFRLVSENILNLVAKWQGIGFIHGVMNTDNMSLAGETIDYGPCAFMDTFEANKKFSAIDRGGRYAYNQQPGIAQWNLSIFASCLVPLVDDDEQKSIALLQHEMNRLPEVYETAWLGAFRAKLGLFNELPEDKAMIEQVLSEFEQQGIDFTSGFRDLTETPSKLLSDRHSSQPQSAAEVQQCMEQHNPWLIPRNHHIEQAINEAYQGDFELFNRLQLAYREPYVVNHEYADLACAPRPEQLVRRTFCGT